MKTKLLLIAFVLIAFTSKSNAQSWVTHTDNFDSYTVGTYVGDPSIGYIMWEGGAYIIDTVPANSGTKLVRIMSGTNPSNLNTYMRKSISVIAGHNYTFSVYTKSVASKNHKIGCKSFSGTNVNVISPNPAFNNVTWQKHSISFIAITSEVVHCYIYIYGAGNVYTDDWEVIDETEKIISANKNTSLTSLEIVKSGLNELTINGCEVNNCRIYDLNGKLIQTSSTNQLDVNSFLKGIYIAKITDKSGAVYNRKFAL